MNRFTILALTLGLAGRVFAHEPIWTTGLAEAARRADNENKLILLDFTGSDWCGWCMKLDAEIFTKLDFLNYASENMVLVYVDFPKHKPQSDELKAANRALRKKYSVRGFPTLLIVKPDGKILWEQSGYLPGGANAMIDTANRCRKAAGLAPPPKPAPSLAAAPVRPIAPAPQKPVEEPPKLQGIFCSPSHSSAVLNGKICEEGESVHGMRILKITRDAVTVEFQGQTRVLTMD